MVDDYLRRHAGERYERQPVADDRRNPGRRDRDRIYYSEAFQRLSDITQILRLIKGQDIILHNRGIHSQKVAALSRTIAERFGDLADPEVADAAGLGHDLGHPPFGHLGEAALNELLYERGVDGFEGNAQTFRVVTKLAWRHSIDAGLDLTRRTLRSLLKYPELRPVDVEPSMVLRRGIYRSEQADFLFATAQGDLPFAIEAEIATIADDITFVLHDLDDFYRGGVLALRELDERSPAEFLASTRERHRQRGLNENLDPKQWDAAFDRVTATLNRIDYQPILEPYNSLKLQYGLLRSFTSHMIDRWIAGVSVEGGHLHVDPAVLHEVAVLKEFVYEAVIEGYAELHDQQRHDRQAVRILFESLDERLTSRRGTTRLPRLLQETLSSVLLEDDIPVENETDLDRARWRAIADYIARLTEAGVHEQAAALVVDA